MVKVLYLQSIDNLVDDQAEKEIHDRISFMNFLDYPDLLPDAKTYGYSEKDYRRHKRIESYGMNYRDSLN